MVRRIARRAGMTKPVGPRTRRQAFITAALDGGAPLRDAREAASHADPRITMRYDLGQTSLDRHGPRCRRRLLRRSCPVASPPPRAASAWLPVGQADGPAENSGITNRDIKALASRR